MNSKQTTDNHQPDYTMDAIVKTAQRPRALELQEVEAPKPSGDDVLIEIKAGGVCGTDAGIYRWEGTGYDWIEPPRIIGHEVAGVVTDAGPDSEDRIGDRVTLNPMLTDREYYGAHFDGGFAEYLAVPSAQAITVPDDIGMQDAAMVEPLTVANHAVSTIGDLIVGDTVLVQGPGPIGVFTAELCRLAGAETIIVAGTNADTEFRLPKIDDLGYRSVNIMEESLESVVKAETPSGTVDSVFDCSGSHLAINDAISVIKEGGDIVVVGTPGSPSEFDLSTVVRSRISIQGSYGYSTEELRRSARLLAAGDIQTKVLATTDFGLADVPDLCEGMLDQTIIKGIFAI